MTNFGDKIRELRKKKSITQEQLANTLGISPQAVSKWEMNAGYPDMVLLPIIAGYFGVSIDVLFDYDSSQIKSKVEDILSEASKHFWGNFDKAEEIYLNGIAAYPGAHELKATLLELYECHMRNNGRLELSGKAITLAEKLLTQTSDYFIVASTKANLASVYKMTDRYEDAKRIIYSMPELWPTQISDKLRSAMFTLEGNDRLENASELKPYMHQDLFSVCVHEGLGYFEIGDYENALISFRQAAAVIELFLKNGKVEPRAYPIDGTQSNHCAILVGIAACLYKLGRIEECEETLKKAYQIPIDYYGIEETEEEPDCFLAYKTAYHKYGLDEYKVLDI